MLFFSEAQLRSCPCHTSLLSPKGAVPEAASLSAAKPAVSDHCRQIRFSHTRRSASLWLSQHKSQTSIFFSNQTGCGIHENQRGYFRLISSCLRLRIIFACLGIASHPRYDAKVALGFLELRRRTGAFGARYPQLHSSTESTADGIL